MSRKLPRLFLTCAVLCTAAGAYSQAVITTSLGREIPVVVPDPTAISPALIDVTFPDGVAPVGGHGLTWVGDDQVIATDPEEGRLLVIDVPSRAVTTIVDAPSGYGGLGTIAVNPSQSHLLFGGGGASLFVTPLPLTSSSVFTTVSLPAGIETANTKAIVFTCDGRAFIYHEDGISAVDPPYTSVAFTIAITSANGGSLALTPDESQLLATVFTPSTLPVLVFDAPFSAGSTPSTIAIANASSGIPIAVTPDGTRALVGGMSIDLAAPIGTSLWSIAAPFGAGSTVERIAMPDAVRLRPGGGLAPPFEDVSISADGQIAMFTGQADEQTLAVPIVRAPFTAAGATVTTLNITGGRGAGSVRMAPTACSTTPPPPPPAASAELSITKTAVATATAGTPLTFTITVRNDGPDAATDVVVTDSLPAGLVLLSTTAVGGTCDDEAPVTCTFASLAADTEAVVTLIARADNPGVVTNTAEVSAAEADSVSADDRDSTVVTIIAAAAAATDVPTASTWALIALAVALAGFAVSRL